MKINSALLILFSLFCWSTSLAQNNFVQQETELKIIGDSILRGSNDWVRTYYCNEFNFKLEKFLNDASSFTYPFDSLKNVSLVISNDKALRIYTWLLPAVSRNNYNYFGFVQQQDKKTKKITLYKLEEGNLLPEEIEKKALTDKTWFGVLYYKIITNKTKEKTIYTLLGWRGNNLKTTMKIIDVLTINKGVLKFGAPVFKTEKGIKQRIIFEYTAQAVMSLSYNEKKKMIVFDHLSPSNPNLKGNYEYYGPDMTYDGYKFQNNSWNLFKNIEIGNPGELDAKTKGTKTKSKDFYSPEK